MQQTEQATTIASYLLAVAKALDSLQIDSKAIFREAGIEGDIHNDPFERISYTVISRVFELSVAATGDPYFGIYASKYMLPSHIHALGSALLSSSTLLDFCERMARFTRFVAKTADFYVDEVDGDIRFSCRLHVDLCPETQDTFWSFILRFMRHLLQRDFSPLKVELHRRVPAEGEQPYRNFFNAPVSFNCEEIAYYFDRELMTQALPTASKELAQMNDQIVIDYLSKLEKKDIVAQVSHLIVELMPSGQINRECIAEKLHMSTRKLQGKLDDEGTSFQALLDGTRYQLACRYMESNTSLSEISYLLGFADASSFSRAFKRWAGVSPSDYQRGE